MERSRQTSPDRGLPAGRVPEGKAGHGHHTPRPKGGERDPRERDPLIRAENEDDDGYDPYSDRTAGPEPLFERDPWD